MECVPIIIVAFGLFLLGVVWAVRGSYVRGKQILKAFELTRHYIEMNLNGKYQVQGIRWAVMDEQRSSEHYDSEERRTTRRTYVMHHILVSSVDELMTEGMKVTFK